MATNPRISLRPSGAVAIEPTVTLPAAYGLGALMLAGEAAVHVQQYVSLFHLVNWIGPLFLANAVACLAALAGLTHPRTRRLAALAGVVISVVALGSLVVSYGSSRPRSTLLSPLSICRCHGSASRNSHCSVIGSAPV